MLLLNVANDIQDRDDDLKVKTFLFHQNIQFRF